MEDIIDILNGDDYDRVKSLLRTFDGPEILMKVLAKRNLLDRLDPGADNSELWKSEWISECVQKDPGLLTNFIENQFDDVEIVNGQAKLSVWRLDDLAELFDESGRRTLDQETIARILSGDYDNDSWFNVDVDYWLPELNKRNLEYLKELVIKELKDVEVEPNTDTLYNIAENHDSDYVTVDENNINLIFSDFKSVEYIFEEYLDELNDDIRRAYLDGYNSAWADTLYNDIMKEIEYVFGEMKTQDMGKQTKYIFNIPDFWDEIKNNSEDIENYFHYIDFYKSRNAIEYYPPDYPNSKFIEDSFNSYFSDSIG
jgi:hypothetical protein